MNFSSESKSNKFVFDMNLLFSKIIYKNINECNKILKLYQTNVKISLHPLFIPVVKLDLTKKPNTYLSIEYHSQR